jgi:hypothetical protein
MRVKLWFAALVVVAAPCLAGLPAHAQPQSSSQQPGSDPVADASRKARDEKKNAPKPKKVFTDDDVKPAASSPNNPAGANGAAPAGAQKEGDTGQAADPNSEATWRKRFNEQRDKIAKAEKEMDILQREEEKAQTQYYPDPQKALKEQNSRKDINEKQARIEAKKQEIAQLRQGLDDLEDQLRKSGGDPGWAR